MSLAGLDIDLYGQAGTKSIDELFAETQNGECRLAWGGYTNILYRRVEVVRMDVYCDRHRLVEVEQRFSDGRKRHRILEASLAEKMKPGETQEEAVIRLIQEEAPVFSEDCCSVPAYKRSIEEQKTSGSYPGLATRYVFHDYDWFLVGVNTSDDITVKEPDKEVLYRWITVVP